MHLPLGYVIVRQRAARTSELFEPRLAVRLRARAHRVQLDRALAGGADPSASPLLAARAAQLVDPTTRQWVADSLELFASSVGPPRGLSKALPLRGAVQRNRAALLQLARTLRDRRSLYALGMARLELVLSDGTGPAYTDPSGEGLAQQLALAGRGLSGSGVSIAS